MLRKQFRSSIDKLSLILFIVLMFNEIIFIGLYVAQEHFQLHALLPPALLDIRLWIAITAINLLATSEITSPYLGRKKLYIKNERLKRVAVILGILFHITVAVEIYKIIIT